MSKSSRKAEQRAAVEARLDRALRGLYHNATPRYPVAQNDYEAHLFDEWFEDAAQAEIDYIRDGGAYGSDAGQSLAEFLRKGAHCPTCGSRKARNYLAQVRAERERCNDLDTLGRSDSFRFTLRYGLVRNTDAAFYGTNAMWEWIGQYGKLYQWGRGGRTLATDGLINERGGSGFSIKDAQDLYEGYVGEYADRVRLLRVLESFNAHVGAWCDDVPAMWKEYKDEEELQPEIDAHEGMKPVERWVTEWVKA